MFFASAYLLYVYIMWVNFHLAYCLNCEIQNFNQEKALVGAVSVIVHLRHRGWKLLIPLIASLFSKCRVSGWVTSVARRGRGFDSRPCRLHLNYLVGKLIYDSSLSAAQPSTSPA